MRTLPPYQCPCCGYETKLRADMNRHLFKKKPCPKLKGKIDLTHDIKEHILTNRVYSEGSEGSNTEKDKVIEELKIKVSMLSNKRNEDFYQTIVEKYLGGTHKVIPHIGTTDVTTDSIHAEIKNWEFYSNALGQLLKYSFKDPKEKLQVYLFGKCPSPLKQKIVLELFESNKVEVYTFALHIDTVDIINAHTKEVVFTYEPDV